MRVHRHIWTAALCGLAGCTGVLSDPTLPVPDDSVRYVFTTGGRYVGAALHGLDGADQICATAAAEVSLPGTYKAWLSDAETSVAARFRHAAVPYQLVNGVQIAANFDDLTDGKIDHAIDLDEHGGVVFDTKSPLIAPRIVWTATLANGALMPWSATNANPTDNPRPDCGAWSTNLTGVGVLGLFDATDASWSSTSTGLSCDETAHLYCFEQ